MADPVYLFTRDQFPLLLLRKFYPERTDGESAVIRDFLLNHINDFDRLQFSVRIGEGVAPDPSLPESTQRQASFNSKKRIDILAWRGNAPTIVEVKQRVTPASLGQILTYRHLWMVEHPDAPEPNLVVVGRTSDKDTLQSLAAHGITTYIYEGATAAGHDAGVGV